MIVRLFILASVALNGSRLITAEIQEYKKVIDPVEKQPH